MRATVEITKLVDAGIALKSTLPWASPVVMVRKKNCWWRMCIDYKRLNANPKFDCFPLSWHDKALYSFSGAVVFSSLYLAMAYLQVPVDPADVEQIAFLTHVGLYEMVKMPFGLCNTQSTYRLIFVVLQSLIGRIWLGYLDDVIVYSKRIADYVLILRAVFERIREAKLKLELSKCSFFRSKVLYLGHVINASGTFPDPSNMRVLLN